MNEDQDQMLVSVADSIAKHYNMTGSDLLAYVAMGERRHGDAPDCECGVVHPSDEGSSCRRPLGHGGDHNGYLLDTDWPELVRDPDPYPFWWTQFGGNTPSERKARGE